MIQFKSLKRNQMDYSNFHQENPKNTATTTLKCSMNLTVHRKSVNNITK